MGSHVSRLFPGPRPPRLPACRSRHVKLPGTRAQRRKLRSRLRAARHQASAAGDAAVAAAVETVALRPAVARVLDSEARGRGLTRSSFCVAVLADYARDAAAPDRAAPSRRAPERVLPDSPPAPSDPSTCVPAVPPTVPAGYVGDPPGPVPAAPSPLPVFSSSSRFASRSSVRQLAAALLVSSAVAAVAAAWFLVAALRYDLVPASPGEALVLDRLTGRIWACGTDPLRVSTPSCRSVVFRVPGGTASHTLASAP